MNNLLKFFFTGYQLLIFHGVCYTASNSEVPIAEFTEIIEKPDNQYDDEIECAKACLQHRYSLNIGLRLKACMYRTTDKKCLYTVNQELTIPYGDVSKKSAFCIIPQPLGKNEMYF